MTRLRAQAILTANAIKNLADAIEKIHPGTHEAAAVLREHSRDLMAEALKPWQEILCTCKPRDSASDEHGPVHLSLLSTGKEAGAAVTRYCRACWVTNSRYVELSNLLAVIRHWWRVHV